MNKYKLQLKDNTVIETQGESISDAVDNYIDVCRIYNKDDKLHIKNRLMMDIVRVLGSNIFDQIKR